MATQQIAVIVGSLRRGPGHAGRLGRRDRHRGGATAPAYPLACLDMPTLGQPQVFLQAKEDLCDADGNIGDKSRDFLKGWMNGFVAWVRKHGG